MRDDSNGALHQERAFDFVKNWRLAWPAAKRRQCGMNETRWRGDRATRAVKRRAAIGASIMALQDNDLLDFADIFVGQPQMPPGELAAAEMAKRNIAL